MDASRARSAEQSGQLQRKRESYAALQRPCSAGKNSSGGAAIGGAGAKSGLLGPYRLNFDTIDAAITRSSAGVYALGYTSPEGRFCINHVGRADTDVKSKLRNCIGSATLFKFGYLPTSKAAFERECELFHDLSPPGNRVHPGRAQGLVGNVLAAVFSLAR